MEEGYYKQIFLVPISQPVTKHNRFIVACQIGHCVKEARLYDNYESLH